MREYVLGRDTHDEFEVLVLQHIREVPRPPGTKVPDGPGWRRVAPECALWEFVDSHPRVDHPS